MKADYKLYVLLEHKKKLTRKERLRKRLIGLLNHDQSDWYGKTYQGLELTHIFGDEPTDEQLEKYVTRNAFHKDFPPYTHSSSQYLGYLWKCCDSNPRNWWRSKNMACLIGFWLTVLGVMTGVLKLLLSQIGQKILPLIDG